MEKKSILKNSIFNIIYKGFTALFPLITTTYIARTLLPEAGGKVSYANTIATYFVTVAALGLPNYGVKKIAQSRKSRQDRSQTFFELYCINIVSTLICIAAYYLFINLNGYFADRRALFNVMGSLLVLNLFNIDWFYQGIEEYGYIAFRSIIIKIASFVAMLLFVHSPSDYLIYAVILCVATAGNYILNVINVRKYIDITFQGLKIRQHLRPVFVLLASTMATEVYTALDTIMLEYIHGEIYVGYYSNVVKIVRMVYTVVIAMVAPFYPRISLLIKEKNYDQSNHLLSNGFRAVAVIGIPTVVGLFLVAEQIVYVLFGVEYTPSIPTLRILSILVMVFSIAYLLGHLVLMASSQENTILKATICGAIVNACLNSLLIPNFKQDGAAIASVIAEITVTSILIHQAKKHFKLYIERKFWITIALACVVMGGSVILIESFVSSTVLSLIASIAVGALSYFIILLITQNGFVVGALNKLRKR
jgi:O-antigen/teichoic acid export membrane protein